MEKLRQRQGVVGQPGHQVPNGMAVKIGEGQPLTVMKQLGAHVPFHFGADGVALVVHKIAAQRLNGHQPQQQPSNPQDFSRGGGQVAGKHVFGDGSRPQGQNQPDGRGSQGAKQVRGEQSLIGLVKGQNLSKCVGFGLQKEFLLAVWGGRLLQSGFPPADENGLRNNCFFHKKSIFLSARRHILSTLYHNPGGKARCFFHKKACPQKGRPGRSGEVGQSHAVEDEQQHRPYGPAQLGGGQIKIRWLRVLNGQTMLELEEGHREGGGQGHDRSY